MAKHDSPCVSRNEVSSSNKSAPFPEASPVHTASTGSKHFVEHVSLCEQPCLARCDSRSICMALDRGIQGPIDMLSKATAPIWTADNDYIWSGYRPKFGWRLSLKSMCWLHNETLNVWTHFIGLVAMVVVLAFTVAKLSPYGADRLDALKQLSWVGHRDLASSFPVLEAPIWPGDHGSDECVCLTTNQSYCATASEAFRGVMEAVQRNVPSMRSLRQFSPDGPSEEKNSPSGFSPDFTEALTLLEKATRTLRHALTNVCWTCVGSLPPVAAAWKGLMDQVHSFTLLLQQQPHAVSAMFDRLEQNSRELYSKALRIGDGISFLEYLSPTVPQDVISYLPRWPLLVFIISALFCLACSTIYHLFQCVNASVALALQGLDFAGISVLVAGSQFPLVYYGFRCYNIHIAVYTTISVVLACFGTCVTVSEKFRSTSTWVKLARAAVFIAMGVFGLIPMVHMFVVHGEVLPFFWYCLVMGVLYIGGALMYATKVPERCLPGAVDIWGHSHQIFHVCVMLAIAVHYVGLVRFYEWRILRECNA